jgi:hypothetical protein
MKGIIKSAGYLTTGVFLQLISTLQFFNFSMKNKKCPGCGLVNFPQAVKCKRCNSALDESASSGSNRRRFEGVPTRANGAADVSAAFEASTRDARVEGWKKVKIGGLITIVFIAVITGIIVSGYQITRINPFTIVPALAPIAWFLAGVLEIVTGVPFTELAQKWDHLQGWQRGVIGISVFVGGLFLLAVACVIIILALDSAQGIKR